MSEGSTRLLNEILIGWPEDGCLITDALDAVRDPDTHRRLRTLMRDIVDGASGWKVLASVREFDLAHGRELRQMFPGEGVHGFSSKNFEDVSHFHLSGLSNDELKGLANSRDDIRPFLERADPDRTGGVHRSPFYLRLAAEILCDGTNPHHLADWQSPAMLLGKHWEARVGGTGSDERTAALERICQRLVAERAMTLSLRELALPALERKAVVELRSQNVLSAPLVGEEEIRFAHHLLHDYAIARVTIPAIPERFCRFLTNRPLTSVFYRQSVIFSLEEIWGVQGRKSFWSVAMQLEGSAELFGVTRILAPVFATRRVENLSDLQPLLVALDDAGSLENAAKALQHLCSSLQDVDSETVGVGATGWCHFAEELSERLKVHESIEGSLANLIQSLNRSVAVRDNDQQLALNHAARLLLQSHIAKPVREGWRFPAMVSSEALCRTYAVAVSESEATLFSLLSEDRLKKFPHQDLFDLAHYLEHLGPEGDSVVVRVFEAAFSTAPEPGQWENMGGSILGLRMQTSDEWNSIHYSLSKYYCARNGENAQLMTEAVCIAWNSVVHRRSERRHRDQNELASILFRNEQCPLVEDYSHIWGRDFEREENLMLNHFEKLLRGWAKDNEQEKLNAALDGFARRNCTSLMWTVFMGIGCEYPQTLGELLRSTLNEPLFLTHPDFTYGAVALLRALHKVSDSESKLQLENLILNLPKNARLHEGEARVPTPSWVTHAQNRLLGSLQTDDIVSEELSELRRARESENPLPGNIKPVGTKVYSRTLSDVRNGPRFSDHKLS